jgi:hypothetical protein
MPGIRSSQATLNEIRNGELMHELAAEIHNALMAVRTQGKPATVKVELTITPQNKHLVEPYITISGEVSSKLPKPEIPGTIFMIDEDGNPTRNLTKSQSDLSLSIAPGMPKEGTNQ